MGSELTLAEILRLEDDPALLAARCPDTGIPLWSTIRSPFLRLIMGDLLYNAELVGAGGVSGALASGGALRSAATIARALVHNTLRPGVPSHAYPVMLMASGARLVRQDGRYFNCLSDYFVGAAAPDTLALEQHFGSRWPFPRQHRAVLMHAPLRVHGVLAGKLRAGQFRTAARALVALACARAQAATGWQASPARRAWLEHYCATASGSLLPRYQRYTALFRRRGVRCLIKEEACYGGADNASAMRAARDAGIVTAEYQHGAVSRGHDAYNYAPAVLADAHYRALFPDYFLAYGSWWGEQMNAPVKVLAIGNPHRNETLAAVPSSSTAGPRRAVLVLGDGLDTDLYLGLCAALADGLGPERELVFRPHPLERAAIGARFPDGRAGAVRIDRHPDIYQSFSEAEAVVSEVSTGLFDAIGVVRRIFVWNTAKARFSLPDHPFGRFDDAGALLAQLRDPDAGVVGQATADSVWARDWRAAYTGFLASALAPAARRAA